MTLTELIQRIQHSFGKGGSKDEAKSRLLLVLQDDRLA